MLLSWFKKTSDFYSNRKIKLLRKMPEGYKLIFVWDCILAEGIKSPTPGIIKPLGNINDYLSALLDLEVHIIKLAIDTFNSLEMAEIEASGNLIIKNFPKYQSLDQIEYRRALNRLKTQKHRKKIAEKYDEVKKIDNEIIVLKDRYNNKECNGYSNDNETRCNTTEKRILEKRKEEDIREYSELIDIYFNNYLIDNHNNDIHNLKEGKEWDKLYAEFMRSDYYKNKVPKGLKK